MDYIFSFVGKQPTAFATPLNTTINKGIINSKNLKIHFLETKDVKSETERVVNWMNKKLNIAKESLRIHEFDKKSPQKIQKYVDEIINEITQNDNVYCFINPGLRFSLPYMLLPLKSKGINIKIIYTDDTYLYLLSYPDLKSETHELFNIGTEELLEMYGIKLNWITDKITAYQEWLARKLKNNFNCSNIKFNCILNDRKLLLLFERKGWLYGELFIRNTTKDKIREILAEFSPEYLNNLQINLLIKLPEYINNQRRKEIKEWFSKFSNLVFLYKEKMNNSDIEKWLSRPRPEPTEQITFKKIEKTAEQESKIENLAVCLW